jgi:hypothetical protein
MSEIQTPAGVVTEALRDALALCDYLRRIWPEVGTGVAVAETQAKVTAALAVLDQARQGDSVGASLRGLEASIEKLRVTVEEGRR